MRLKLASGGFTPKVDGSLPELYRRLKAPGGGDLRINHVLVDETLCGAGDEMKTWETQVGATPFPDLESRLSAARRGGWRLRLHPVDVGAIERNMTAWQERGLPMGAARRIHRAAWTIRRGADGHLKQPDVMLNRKEVAAIKPQEGGQS